MNNILPNDMKINELQSKIKDLNSKLLEEQNKNYNLTKENNMLKQQINQFQNQNNFQNNNFSYNPNQAIETINKLLKQIDNLNEKIQRYPYVLEKNEKLISLIFSSGNQFYYSLICKNTDTINKIEAEIYKEYPNLSETQNFFLCKGKILNKFKTFDENQIKNGDSIIINQMKNSIYNNQ